MAPVWADSMNIELGSMWMSDRIAPDSSIELFRIQPGTAGALYEQLAQRIAAAITSNKLQPGAALPSERLLSERLQISRTTVRKALDELIECGLVTSHHGSGNFVATPRLEQPLAGLSSLSEDMCARGRRPAAPVRPYGGCRPRAARR